MTVADTIQTGQPGPLTLASAMAFARVMPITIENYQRMIDEGIVPEDSRVELLRGVMVWKDRSALGEDSMGHSPLHVAVVSLLTALAAKINCERWHLKIQLPVACPPDSAPEPDGYIVRGTPRDYLDRLPGPADVSCVIEAAHSSLGRDREDKAPIYAGAGIPQYVIVNLQNMTLEVHTDPDAEREEYRAKVTIQKGERVRLQLPEGVLEVEAGELLP